MKLRLSKLADMLGLAFSGDDVKLSGVSSLEKAGPNDLTFLAHDKYLPLLETTRAGAVIVQEQHATGSRSYLISKAPQLDFAKILHHISVPQGEQRGVHKLAHVHPDAKIGKGCVIYPYAFVGPRARLGPGCRIFPHAYVGEDCVLGKECTLYPGAVMLSPTQLGDRVTLHPSAVLGTDGFGFVPTPDGVLKIPQVGRVVIEDDVEIGALSAVDRATVDETTIGEQTKLDNHVQVGHNATIGPQCLVAGHSGISGSTTLGKGVILAARVGLVDHITLGDGVIVGASSGVTKDIPAGQIWAGLPAHEQRTFRRMHASLPKLPEFRKRLSALEKEVTSLKEQLAKTPDGEE